MVASLRTNFPENFTKILGIKKLRTTSCEQRTNGALERWHKTLNSVLAKWSVNHKKDCSELVLFAVFEYIPFHTPITSKIKLFFLQLSGISFFWGGYFVSFSHVTIHFMLPYFVQQLKLILCCYAIRISS